MTTIMHLHELQELDLEIAQCQSLFGSVDGQLGDRSGVDALLRELESQKAGHHEIRLKQRAQTLSAESVRAKVHDVEGKLYGGTITNLRELEGYEREAAFLGGQLRKLDDELLEAMLVLEDSEQRVRSMEDGCRQAEEEWGIKQTQLAEERKRLEDALATLDSRRQRLVSRIGSQELKLYEDLRLTKGGLAIAKVEQGRCRGCSMALPTQQLQRVRAARESVRCGSCGRILYLS